MIPITTIETIKFKVIWGIFLYQNCWYNPIGNCFINGASFPSLETAVKEILEIENSTCKIISISHTASALKVNCCIILWIDSSCITSMIIGNKTPTIRIPVIKIIPIGNTHCIKKIGSLTKSLNSFAI